MFFEEKVEVRCTQKMIEEIEKILKEDDGEKYDNLSHFFRCSALKEIKDYKKNKQ